MKDIKKQYKDYLNSKDGAGKYNDFKEILYGKDDSLVLELFKIIQPKLKSKNDLNILDVGGGDGKRLMHLVRLFQEKSISVKAELVEPSQAFTERCRKEVKVKKYPIAVKGSIFEKFNTGNKYDLIIFIHSIYTFRNNDYLKKVKKLLRKDGLAVFVVNDGQSFLAGLKKITDLQYGTSRNEMSSLLVGLKKERYEIKKFDTKFSGVLGKRGINKKGKLILEWIGMRPFLDIPANIRQAAEEFFIRSSEDRVIKEKEVVIMVRKAKSISKK